MLLESPVRTPKVVCGITSLPKCLLGSRQGTGGRSTCREEPDPTPPVSTLCKSQLL